jgi:predicted porin
MKIFTPAYRCGFGASSGTVFGAAFGIAAVIAAAVPGAAFAAQVYHDEDGTDLSVFGRVEARYMDKTSRNERKGGIEGRTRLGVAASSKIVSGVKAVAFGEWEAASATSQNGKWNTRYAYTGFDFSQYGTLVFGQGESARYLAAGFTDVFEDAGFHGQNYPMLGERQEGQVMYAVAVGGYTLSASLQTPNRGMGRYFDHDRLVWQDLDVNLGFAAAGTYNWTDGLLDGLAFGISYDWYDNEHSVSGDRHDFGVAFSYGHLGDGLYTAVQYSREKFKSEKHHSTGWEAVGGYTFECGLGFMLGFGYEGYHFDRSENSYLAGQISYDFNPSLKLYGEGELGLGRLDYPLPETKQHSRYEIGLMYSF